MSEASPEVRAKSAVSSNVGVTTWPKPARSKTRTAASIDALAQGDARRQPVERRDGARTGSLTGAAPRERGSSARSSPSVVGSPWPDRTGVSGGNSSSSDAMLACSVGQSPSRRSVRPTEPRKSTSPAVQRAVDPRTARLPGRVARARSARRSHRGPSSEPLAAVQQVVGLMRLGVLVARVVVSAELAQPWQPRGGCCILAHLWNGPRRRVRRRGRCGRA